MKITYIEPIANNKKRVERVFGCSYANYVFPNIYALTILASLEKKYAVSYNQAPLYFKDDASFSNFLKHDGSDIYFISSVNLSMEDDVNFAKRLIKLDESKKIIFWGPAPTYFPEKFLIHKNVYVVRGEPDLTIPALIDILNNQGTPENIDGVSFLIDNQVVHNRVREIIDNLDMLPFPARHLLDERKFYNPKLGKKPFTAVMTSRGCSHRCIYCVPCALNFARELEFKKNHNYKPPVHLRSAANVIEEFKSLKKIGYKAISIIDDQFVWDKNRTLEICNGIKDLKLSWGCLSRIDHLDEEIIKSMKDAGCIYIDIGVESFDNHVLEYVKKDITAEKLIDGIRLLKRNKMLVKINILFGASPHETKEVILHTLKMVKRLKVDQVMFDICSPFPGTEFFDIAKTHNWIVGDEYAPVDVAHTANINYPHLSHKELERIMRKENLKFYLNPEFIIKNIIRLRNPIFVFEGMTAFFKKVLK